MTGGGLIQHTPTASSKAALHGLRVLDLSRILAGPTATQLLADLGADVIKIERPGKGDDTRGWGPPFLRGPDGRETGESAYYLSANRGKRSLAVDIATARGQDLLRKLAAQSDILVENFKAGDLQRYGLDYATLSAINPKLIYCSITGFGQTGPNAHRAGYDFLVQGEGGLMSLTGDAGGAPLKAGVGIADLMCGLYAANAILAAVIARQSTGKGQHIDIALLDCQIAMLANQGVGYLTDGVIPPRRGNDHPTIVPYGVFPAADGTFILAVGNDAQFKAFVTEAGAPDLAQDMRFAKNADRVRNREELIPLLEQLTRQRPASDWLSRLEKAAVPAGPINDLKDVFDSSQVQARLMMIDLPHERAAGGQVRLIGNPIKMSDTAIHYGKAPPSLGEDSAAVLREVLQLSESEITNLLSEKIIAGDGP